MFQIVGFLHFRLSYKIVKFLFNLYLSRWQSRLKLSRLRMITVLTWKLNDFPFLCIVLSSDRLQCLVLMRKLNSCFLILLMVKGLSYVLMEWDFFFTIVSRILQRHLFCVRRNCLVIDIVLIICFSEMLYILMLFDRDWICLFFDWFWRLCR